MHTRTLAALVTSLYAGAALMTDGLGAAPAEIVLRAADAPVVRGNWSVVSDASAAGGFRLANKNLGAAKIVEMLEPLEHLGKRGQPTERLLQMAKSGEKFYK